MLMKNDEVEKGSRKGDVHTHMYNEIYLKKLPHTTVLLWIGQVCTLCGRLGTHAGGGYNINSKIHRASWQARHSSRVTMSTVFSQNSFFSGKCQDLLLWPSPGCMRPTHMIKGNLSLKSTDCICYLHLQKTLNTIPRPVFDQTSGHHSLATLTHKINYHRRGMCPLVRESREEVACELRSTWS